MIKPKEQLYIQSCLPVSLAMLCDVKMTKKQEGDILLKGLDKKGEGYAKGMIAEFVKVYKKPLNVFIDYKIFAKTFVKFFSKNKQVKCKNVKSTLANMKKLLKGGPIIIYLDAKFLEYDYYADHNPHFIVLEKIKDKKATIIDPWEGKRKDIKISSLEQGLKSLRSRFKFSPIIISL